MQNNFFERVYAVVSCIPKGKVMTYGQIAEHLGGSRSARYVGFAMSGAPEERSLPCHRVVNRKGEMSPGSIFGSPENQRKILKKEGVRFTKDGRVDLEKSLFIPE